MLATRVLTAAVLLPAVLWLMIFGPKIGMFFFILAATMLCVFEMSMMLQPRLDEMLRNYIQFERATGKVNSAVPPVYAAASRRGHYLILALFCSLIAAVIFSMSVYLEDFAGRGLIVVGLIFAALSGVFATRGIEAEMARVLGFVLSIVYGCLPWLVVWDLYSQTPAAKDLLLALVIVWAGDTGGYFGGRFFGKTKLAPSKSPKKTWEGAAMGLAASVGAALIYFYAAHDALHGGVTTAVLAGFLGGIVGQMGDLVESVFKRFTGVKDSGNLLPGHGGLLDRVDAVLFAAPIVWFILYCAKKNLW